MKENDLEKTLSKKVQQTLIKTRKMAEKQVQELQEAEQNELRKVADEFLEVVREKVDSCVLLRHSKGLSELASAVDIVLGWQVIKIIREKGFSKELTELCDKVGRGEH